MSYAIDGVIAANEAQLLAAISRKAQNVYLTGDVYDLTGETRIEIHASLVALTRATVLLPEDTIFPIVSLHTFIYPFEGMTFEGIDFMMSLAIPVTVPVIGPRVNIRVRKCCFNNLIFAAPDFSAFPPVVMIPDINANVNITDCTILAGMATSADLVKIRRTQYVRLSSDPGNLDPTAPIQIVVSTDAGADQSMYASNFSLQQVDVTPPAQPIVGLTMAPVPPSVAGANRADFFNINSLANTSIKHFFATDESVYLINSTFTSPVDPAVPDTITAEGSIGTTKIFMDLYGVATSVPITGPLIATGAGEFNIGQNQYTVAERGGATITAVAYMNGTA